MERAAPSAASTRRQTPTGRERQLRDVADVFGIADDLVAILGMQKSVEVAIPTTMDDGSVRVFTGYRVTHNVAPRALQGRDPLPPRRHPRRGQGARDVDDLEVRLMNLPFGGAKAGVICDPRHSRAASSNG